MRTGTRRPLVDKLSIGDLRPLLWLRGHRNVYQSKLGNVKTGSDLDDVVGLWETQSHAESLGAEDITNGNMETGDPPANWTVAGAVASRVADERTGGSGTYSANVSYDANGQHFYQVLSCETGKFYKLAFWCKKQSGTLSTFHLHVRATFDAGTLSLEYITHPIGADWVEYTYYFVSKTDNPALTFRSPNGASDENFRFDDVSLKEVLTPLPGVEQPTTAKKPLRKAQGLLFDGIDDYAAQKFYVDETNATWGPAVHGLSLVDGNAFLRVEGVDLSAYEGVEGTDTPYMIVLVDQAGKVAWSYIGNQEAAEGLGGELVTNGDFAANINGWNNAGGAGAYGTFEWSAGTLHIVSDGGGVHYGASDDNISLVIDKLYKATFTIALASGTGPSCRIQDTIAGVIRIDFGTLGTGNYEFYYTSTNTEDVVFQVVHINQAGNFTIDDISIKEVLHAGTDAVHLVSTRHGSSRNWAGIDPAFDYNDDPYTFEVRKTWAQITGAMTMGQWVKTSDPLAYWGKGKTSGGGNYIPESSSYALRWQNGYGFHVLSGGTEKISPGITPAIIDGKWHLVIGVYSPSTYVRTYTDGALAGENTAGIPASINDISRGFALADLWSGDAYSKFSGYIDDAFLLDYALDARSIRQLYEDNKERYR